MPVIEVVQLSDLNTGDQVAVMGQVEDLHPSLRPFMDHTNGVYFHHGIFDRETLEVIDFHGDNKANAKPKRRPILEFVAGRPHLYRVIHEECLPVETTMEMANEAAEEPSRWPGYNLIRNNCETFATYLKTGIKHSAQASAALFNLLYMVTSTTGSGLLAISARSVSSLSAGTSVIVKNRN